MIQSPRVVLRLGVLLAGLACGCSEPADDASLLPDDFRSRYEEVRDCRLSVEHDLVYIVVWADPQASARYLEERYPFDEGALIVKEEFIDEGCRESSGFTLMQRAAAGDPDAHDGWIWQRLDSERRSVTTDASRCAACHAACEERDFTCAQP